MSLLGVVSAFDVPAQQAFQAELAGADGLVAAVRRDSVVLQAGRVVGPALAGFLIPVLGVGQVFVINATTFLAVLVTFALGNASNAPATNSAENVLRS